RVPRHRRVRLGAGAAILMPALLIISRYFEGRYLLFALPGLAILMGEAYAELVHSAVRRSTLAGALAVLALSTWLLDTTGWKFVQGRVNSPLPEVTIADFRQIV